MYEFALCPAVELLFQPLARGNVVDLDEWPSASPPELLVVAVCWWLLGDHDRLRHELLQRGLSRLSVHMSTFAFVQDLRNHGRMLAAPLVPPYTIEAYTSNPITLV